MSERKFTRRHFLKLTLGSLLGSAFMGVGGYGYATQIEPDWIKVERVNLKLPRLPAAFNGYHVVQISDIHKDNWMTYEKLAHIVEMVNLLEPDTIAITGDFFTEAPEYHGDDVVSALSKLVSKDLTIAVLGNHDHWKGAQLIREILQTSGIKDIGNSLQTLKRGSAQLHFAGVDDYWEGQDRLDLVLEQLPPEGCAILLAHEPDYADISAPTGRFDLQISGHSHGGQVNLPFFGPPITPMHGHKYPIGLYQVGDMLQYTNRGVGTMSPHVRFNCRPEITLFTLLSPGA